MFLTQCIKQLLIEEEGTTAVEYAVMLGFILGVIISAVSLLGNGGNGIWANNNNKLHAAGL